MTARRRCWSTIALLFPLVAAACADDPLPDGGSDPTDAPVVIPAPDEGDGIGTDADAGDTADADSRPAACSTQPSTEGTRPFSGPASAYCGPGGWCYGTPLPVAMDVKSLWGLRSDSVWAAGTHGTILRWDGSSWAVTRHGQGTILAVGGADDDDLWALGSGIGEHYAGALLHWDGQTWSQAPAQLMDPAARDLVNAIPNSGVGNSVDTFFVWGLRRDDMWAGTPPGKLMHWDGQIWRVVNLDGGKGWVSIRAVWGSAPDDLWAVGNEYVNRINPPPWPAPPFAYWSRIYHWDGRAWSLAYADPDQDDSAQMSRNLKAVWGSSKTDVWAVGAHGQVVHWDGSEWKRQPDVPKQPDLLRVMVTGPRDVWASRTPSVGGDSLLHWDGTAWSERAGRGGPLWAGGPGDLWIAPWRKVMERWDGCQWSKAMGGVAIEAADFWANSASDVWSVGGNVVARWDGTSWKEGPPSPGGPLAAVSGTAPDDLWVAGKQTLAHWNGSSWRSFEPLVTVANPDGGQPYPSELLYTDLWSSGRDDVWVTGAVQPGSRSWFLGHWQGERWTVTHILGPIAPLWGTARDDLWRTGSYDEGDGLMYHWDGSTWTPSPIPDAGPMCTSISGTSRADVWAYCSAGLFHKDDTTWGRVTGPPDGLNGLLRIAAVGPGDDVWALVGNGGLWRWKGGAWSRAELDTSASAILVTPKDIWVNMSHVNVGQQEWPEPGIRRLPRDPPLP